MSLFYFLPLFTQTRLDRVLGGSHGRGPTLMSVPDSDRLLAHRKDTLSSDRKYDAYVTQDDKEATSCRQK